MNNLAIKELGRVYKNLSEAYISIVDVSLACPEKQAALENLAKDIACVIDTIEAINKDLIKNS